MSLIQSISSTLKTWVFKKKILKFSDRYERDPMACFYCPEMCRFSCPTAESQRNNAITPRGKMSVLHLMERGHPVEEIAGSREQTEWVLDQCSGCGRCTEYCLYEIDVASNLRGARGKLLGLASAPVGSTMSQLRGARGEVVLLSEPSRVEWWRERPALLKKLGATQVIAGDLPARAWESRGLSDEDLNSWRDAFASPKQVVIESAESGWFVEKGLKHEGKDFGGDVTHVWQHLFSEFLDVEFPRDASFHESFYLGRNFPRIGVSVPMYEKGSMPFHSGWNTIDCGGESFYTDKYPAEASEMAKRFAADLAGDGRKLSKIVVQNMACAGHLRASLGSGVEVVYWLDLLGAR